MTLHDDHLDSEIARLQMLDRECEALSKYSRNLNLAAIQGKTSPVYNREDVLDSVQKILLRRNKANILLTGLAGCGKTAIAEGLAHQIVQTRLNYKRSDNRQSKPLFLDCVIYELSMNSLVSGSKYRGEFEEKMEAVLQICATHPNIILFIDEIHQIGVIGAAEGASNMGQILKPALARGDVRIIGATTIDESEYIKKDKALARRFAEVMIQPLNGKSAVQCLVKIMKDYESFHAIKLKNIEAKTLLDKVESFMPNSVFPNNVIDVIDETLASAKYDGKKMVTMDDINHTLSRITGYIIVDN